VQGIKYSVDIVLCIDATGSMGSIIHRVKSNALKFYEDLNKNMEEKSKAIDILRLRVIVFRDYYADGDDAVVESDFFVLPQSKEDFSSFVNVIEAFGGGDDPESGLEGLALAIKSNWSKEGDKRRQIIVMWTDTSSHKLEKNEGHKPSNYPSDMPKNFDEITDMWEGQSYVNQAAKRLVIYAPDAYPWTDIANHWENVVHYSSRAGDGLADVDYQEIITAIANSV
jgi:hypothetical protein